MVLTRRICYSGYFWKNKSRGIFIIILVMLTFSLYIHNSYDNRVWASIIYEGNGVNSINIESKGAHQIYNSNKQSSSSLNLLSAQYNLRRRSPDTFDYDFDSNTNIDATPDKSPQNAINNFDVKKLNSEDYKGNVHIAIPFDSDELIQRSHMLDVNRQITNRGLQKFSRHLKPLEDNIKSFPHENVRSKHYIDDYMYLLLNDVNKKVNESSSSTSYNKMDLNLAVSLNNNKGLFNLNGEFNNIDYDPNLESNLNNAPLQSSFENVYHIHKEPQMQNDNDFKTLPHKDSQDNAEESRVKQHYNHQQLRRQSEAIKQSKFVSNNTNLNSNSERARQIVGHYRNREKQLPDRESYVRQQLSAKEKRKDIRKCNQVRMQRLKNRCKDLSDVTPLYQRNSSEIHRLAHHVITDDQHRVLINALPKTGCSSWKMVLLNNSGLNITSPGQRPPTGAIHNWHLLNSYGLNDLGQYSTSDIRLRLQYYFTILTVRHPFERLESAYREKFTTNNKLYRGKLGPVIIEKYRKEQGENMNSSVVSFEEFLHWTLEVNNTDRHWTPYWDMAHPCVLPYKYIAKTETASRDMDYIAATKLSPGVSGGGYQYNPTQNEEKVATSRAKTLPLFSALHRDSQDDLLLKVLNKYMDDMELFGYRIRKDNANNIIADCEMYSPEGMCC